MAQEDKNLGGRPTKYTPELLKKARAYAENHKVAGDRLIPTVEGLALYCDIRRSTLYDWCNDPDKWEFSDIVDKVVCKQTVDVIDGCLTGEMKESTGGKLLGKQGYTNTHQVDNISSDGSSAKPVIVELVGVSSESAAQDTE